MGPPRAQATAKDFGWPELVSVTDLGSAQKAIDTILEQGEGCRGGWEDAHFGQFVQILDEYRQMKEDKPGFEPVRPVMHAKVRPGERDEGFPLIGDPITSRCTDLFNVGYEVLLQIFSRYFAHTEESDVQLGTLAGATLALMLRVIKPLADLITTLPVGPEHPGRTAGPSFELFYEAGYLMPHREAAWTLIEERLRDACVFAESLQKDSDPVVSERLAPVAQAPRRDRRLARRALRRLGRGQPLRRRPADFGGSPRRRRTVAGSGSRARLHGRRRSRSGKERAARAF